MKLFKVHNKRFFFTDKVRYIILLPVLFFISSCEKYLGEKTDLDFIEIPDYNATRQVAYVPILPVLDGFERPVDICTGFDQLFYIVDEAAEEVICMDEAGNILGSKFIPGARAVAQDRKFDLLVIGKSDTTLIQGGTSVTRTFSTIYRLRMIGGTGYNISDARIINKIVHPFYFKSTAGSTDEINNVRFNKIAVIGNNTSPEENNGFYVTRKGINVTGVLGPDDAIVYFNNQDQFVSTVMVSTPTEGVRNDFFADPMGITTFTQPPQINARGGRNFIYTSIDPDNGTKLTLIEYFETEFGSYYSPRQLASGDTSKAEGFINSPNKFGAPTGVTVAGDASQYIFVTDTLTDSLYQFTFTGYEGVQPPAATGITKFQKASFGGPGIGVDKFNNPTSVAYYNEIIYVTDADNGRILRFKLTTDFD